MTWKDYRRLQPPTPRIAGPERQGGEKYRALAMRAASQCMSADGSMLAAYGFAADRAPLYEKRFGGTDLRMDAIAI